MCSQHMDLERIRGLIYKEDDFDSLKSNTSEKEPTFYITDNVNFFNEKWDFSKKKLPNIPIRSYIYKFDDIQTTQYKVFLKKMILRQIVKETSFNTIRVSFDNVKSFIHYLENERYVLNPQLISKKVFADFVEKLKLTEKIKRRTLGDLKKFLIVVEAAIPSFTMKDFNEVLKDYDIRRIKIQNELGKTPNIPKSVFTNIIKMALEDIDNQELRIIDRMTSCLVLIESQTGIRRNELLILERRKLNKTEIFKGKKSVYYLEFFTSKTTRSSKGKWTETYMNDIAVKAYQTLELLSENRLVEGSIALYPKLTGDFYSTTSLMKYWDHFFIRHQNNLGIELLDEFEMKCLQKLSVNKRDIGKVQYIKQGNLKKKLYKINPHQFRVAVANQLKEQGVSLQWIKEHMNHLEEDMTKHYFRDDKVMEKVLVKRVTKDGSQLETNPEFIEDEKIRTELNDPHFKEAYETINKYLKKNKINVFRDLDSIIKVFKETPISGSELGFCTKAFGKLCERQERLSAMERWYYARPQIIDISLVGLTVKRLEEKLQIVQHNFKVLKNNNKHQNDYQRELKALKQFYLNKFEPEFELLKQSLENDYDAVITSNTNLKGIASNIKEIEKLALEVREWIKI